MKPRGQPQQAEQHAVPQLRRPIAAPVIRPRLARPHRCLITLRVRVVQLGLCQISLQVRIVRLGLCQISLQVRLVRLGLRPISVQVRLVRLQVSGKRFQVRAGRLRVSTSSVHLHSVRPQLSSLRLLLLPMPVGRARNTIPPGTMRVPDHPTTDHRPPDSRRRSTVKTYVFSMRALRPRMRPPRL